MGIEISVLDTNFNSRKAQLLCESDNNFTSVITVQGHQRVNVGILVGSQISDIISAASLSTSISGIMSIFSGTITLQRRMAEEAESYHWRDVDDWTISSVAINTGGSENITAYPEPFTCQYRAGIKTGDYTNGVAHIRIGTT